MKKIFEDINFLIDNNEVKLNKTLLKDKSNLLIKQGILQTYKEFINKNKFEECLKILQETNVKYLVLTNEELKEIVKNVNECKLYTLNLNWIDTVNITDMSNLFAYNLNFNGIISEWNTSNVKNMKNMFYHAKSFNLPIGNWNVSNVINMEWMFTNAIKFNLPIGNWDVSNVKNMYGMLADTESFNLPIGNWDVSNAKNMRSMFSYAESFNLPIGNWDVSNVINMGWMFSCAKSFNLDISKWDVSNVRDNNHMFNYCNIKDSYKPMFLKLQIFEDVNFLIDNDNEIRLNRTSVKDLANLKIAYYANLEVYKNLLKKNKFKECLKLWQETNVKYLVLTNNELKEIISQIYIKKLCTLNLNWLDTKNITDMSNLFSDIDNFNGDISKWDVSNVKDMASMFDNAKSFNLDISMWNTSNVKNMWCMFSNAKSFNLPIGDWDVSNVINMEWMFEGAESFNLDISMWNTINIKYEIYMFKNCPIKKEYKPKFK